MTLEELNTLSVEQAKTTLSKCCGSSRWVKQMTALRPFEHEAKLFAAARDVWSACSHADWLEAFTHHPRIGDVNELEKKFAATKEWAGQEQQGVKSAGGKTLERLAQLNSEYEKRFGYIFIVCATGKTAEEMLALVQQRLHNNPDDELIIAMGEQDKITALRLKKLLS